MAFQFLHSFTDTGTGVTFWMLVDYCKELRQTDYDEAGDYSGTLTSAADLGFAPGETIGYACVGDYLCVEPTSTKRKAVAILVYPFFDFIDEPGSSDCAYVAPVCDYTFVVTPTDATNSGANGKLTISGLVGTFQFSLDNATWQSSPVFDFLLPGTYNVFVRNEDCNKSTVATVGNSVVDDPATKIPDTIHFEDSRKMCYFFRLIVDGVTTAIQEPIKWDQVNIMGERDPEFHGYLFKYSDGNIDLSFDCVAGRAIIENEYNLHGQDGEVLFQFGYTYGGEEFILFPGKLMLNTYKWYAEKVECAVESTELDTVFTSRLETKVSMTQATSFDDVAVPVPVPYNVELHAKQIYTQIKGDRSGVIAESMAYSSSTPNWYIKPDNQEQTLSEIEDNYQYALGGQTTNPTDASEFIVQFQTAGTATITIDLDMDIEIQKIFGAFVSPQLIGKVYFATRKYNAGSNTFVLTKTDITTSPVSVDFSGVPNQATFNIKGSIVHTGTFSIDDEVYCYIDLTFSSSAIVKESLVQNRFHFDVDYLETSVATKSNVWFIEDVIRHQINCITSNRYAFKSTFFQRINALQLVDGCGSKSAVTNGFQIRQFDITNRPLKLDLKKVLRSLNAMHCIGLNYSSDVTGAYVRIERRDYYYQDREIIAIEELASYREEVAIDIIYNEMEFGYEKFQDSGFNSLDEFNTKQEWLNPIKKNKKKLSNLSAFITSGYAIESARREQFKDKPSSSITNDEEPFLISMTRVDGATFTTEKNEAFTTVTGLISPETAYNLRVSPKRMLYNWFIWLKGIFAYKEVTDKITNTLTTQNTDLVTRFDEDETCRVGDVDRAIIAEKEDVTLDNLSTTADIYRPERAFIKCRLNPQQVQVINLAMTSRYGDDKDRGYIMVLKPNGVWQAVWIEKLSYNYANEQAEISGLKKFTSPALPNVEEDCCQWLVVNGCYLKVNGEKLIA